jgi:DnaJ-class molecular chaperone
MFSVKEGRLFDSNKNYYGSLGLPMSASSKEIRKTFFDLAKKHHPDLNE